MMAWVVATQGAEILGHLALVLLCAYLGYAVHALLVYSLSARAFAGMNPIRFFQGASAAMIFAFTSTSSAATLPVSKECAAELGADDDIASFVHNSPMHYVAGFGRDAHAAIRHLASVSLVWDRIAFGVYLSQGIVNGVIYFQL